MLWDVYASTQKANGFPEQDQAAERALTAYYEGLPALADEGHTGQIGNVLSALESSGGRVLIDGHEGRKTLEIITAVYKSAITGSCVRLPLPATDPFCRSEGLLAAAPHFHEKTASVTEFADNEITTTGRQR